MKLKTNKVWFTSDTHYGHRNIVRGETSWRNENGTIPLDNVRDFDSVIEMNQSLVKGINNYVEPSDWLIHLGDWSFGGCPRIKEFREQINCNNIVLILGNHDQHIQRDADGGPFRSLFHRVESYLEVFYSANNHNHRIILCHYPISSWNEMHYGSYMLHGHQHLKGEGRFGIGRSMDVGACGTFNEGEFRPYHIDEVFGLLENRLLETPLY